MKRVRTFIGNLGQWLCVCILSFSIVYEILYKADIGYLGITIGGVLFALFTKIKYYIERTPPPKGE